MLKIAGMYLGYMSVTFSNTRAQLLLTKSIVRNSRFDAMAAPTIKAAIYKRRFKY